MRLNSFMQGGGEPMETRQAKSPMEDLIPAIKAAMQQGTSTSEIILTLAQNEVPNEVIQEALTSAGISQEDVMAAFQELEQQQTQAQSEVESMEGPVSPDMQEAAPEEMAQPQIPMAQDGVEKKKKYPTIDEIKKGGYKVKVIAYAPNKQMPPGHTEAILINKDGTPVDYYIDKEGNKQDAFVNRWEDTKAGGSQLADKNGNVGYDNRPPKYIGFNKKDLDGFIKKNKYNRAMDLNLDSDQMEHFLNSTSLEGGLDYNFMENNCADGVCRAFNLDSDKVGSTYGTKWIGTEPQQVFSQLQENYKDQIENPIGEQMSRENFVKQAALIGASNLDGKLGTAAQLLAVQQSADPTSLLNTAGNVYKGGRAIKNWFEDLLNGNPSAPTLSRPNIKEYEPRDVTLMQSDETSQGPAFTQPLNFKREGGQMIKARYDNVLKQAEYGTGKNTYQNFNQYFQDDKDFRPNINSAYMPMNLGMKGNVLGAVATLAEGAGRLFGKKDRDGDGLADGAFRDWKAKKNRSKAARSLSKGKTPEGMENWQNETMMKYDPKSMSYNVQYDNPMYQSNVKTGNIFTPKSKRKLMNSVNLEGYESFSKLQNNMSNLDQTKKDQVMNLSQDLTDFKTQKYGSIPTGTQFGIDESGNASSYGPNVDLKESQEQINNIMMGNFEYGGSYNKPQRYEGLVGYQQGGQPQQEQIMQQVMQALQQGVPPEEVLGQLVQMGLPEQQAVQLIQAVMQQLQGAQQQAPPQQGMAPEGMPPEGMVPEGQPMMRTGGGLRKYQGDTGSSEVPPLTSFQQYLKDYPTAVGTDTTLYGELGDPRESFFFAETPQMTSLIGAFNNTYGNNDLDNVIDAADDVSWADSPSEKTAAKAAYAAAESAARVKRRNGGIIPKAQPGMGFPMEQNVGVIQQGHQGDPSHQWLAQQEALKMQRLKRQQLEQLLQEVSEGATKANTYRKKSEQDAFYIKQEGGEESPFYSRDKIVAIFSEMVGQGYTPDEAQKNLYNAGVISEQDYDFVEGVKKNHPGITKWSRDEITNAYNSMVNEGATIEEIQKTLYGGNRVSEKDYDFVAGLGSKKRKLKRGGENAPLELTTKQIAQIMAAGGSVKYL